MSKITTFIAAAGFALTLATAASAGTVYDNGAPNAYSGNEVTAWVQAEDFSVGTDATITSATVSLISYYGFGSFDGNVEYWIFGDSEGAPSGTLANGSTNGTITGTDPACCGFAGASFSFDFNDAFHAVAGTQYWFGFHIGEGYVSRNEIYWGTTGGVTPDCEGPCPTAFNNGRESAGGTFDNWFNNGQEHSFSLSSSAPEPASWALMILGFGAAGAALRRRRLVAA